MIILLIMILNITKGCQISNHAQRGRLSHWCEKPVRRERGGGGVSLSVISHWMIGTYVKNYSKKNNNKLHKFSQN